MAVEISLIDQTFDGKTQPPRLLPAAWALVEALWAAGERDWLAPFLAKRVVEKGHLDTLQQLEGVNCWLIATETGQPVGFAILMQQRVVALWVQAENRRRGVGRQLVDAARTVAQGAGCPFLEIEYPTGNKAAVAFCRALGFRPASRRAVEIEGRRVGSGVVFALLPRKYTHSRFMRVAMAGSAVLFALVAIAFREQQPVNLLFLGFALFAAVNMLWTERVVWTDRSGIYNGYVNSRLRHMPWADLRAIEGGTLDQWFTVRGAHDRKIHVSPMMTDIAWLFDTARLTRPDLWRKPNKRVFRVRLTLLIGLVAVSVGWWAFLAIAAVYGPGGAGWQWLLLALPGLYPLVVLLRRIYRLQIDGDTLRIRFLLREEVIPASAIDYVWTQATGSVAVYYFSLELHLKDGRRLNLDGFEGGVGELANTLVAWWQQVQGDRPEL